MTIYDVLNNSPYLSTLVIIVLAVTAGEVIISLWRRIFQHLTIRSQGYPPEHCDADGDFKPAKESEE